MFASVVDALTNNYTPALLSDAAAIEAITSLLQLTDVEHPEDGAVLLACDALVSTGTYSHSRPKELVLDVERTQRALVEALRAQLQLKGANPKPTPDAPTPEAWRPLGMLLDTIRKLVAKMSSAAASGQRHSYVLVTTTPEQQRLHETSGKRRPDTVREARPLTDAEDGKRRYDYWRRWLTGMTRCRGRNLSGHAPLQGLGGVCG